MRANICHPLQLSHLFQINLLLEKEAHTKMTRHRREEYHFLTERLEEIEWALKGECNDIDCDKYLYKSLLKKKYKPVLNHGFSCIKRLRIEKEAVLRILSRKEYKKYRYLKCNVCKKNLDKLSEKSKVVSFTRPIKREEKIFYQWEGKWVHNKCSSKLKILQGWNKS